MEESGWRSPSGESDGMLVLLRITKLYVDVNTSWLQPEALWSLTKSQYHMRTVYNISTICYNVLTEKASD